MGDQIKWAVVNTPTIDDGDNRHNSEDSRYWGFVPENHISKSHLYG
jgi:hypothetical protein